MIGTSYPFSKNNSSSFLTVVYDPQPLDLTRLTIPKVESLLSRCWLPPLLTCHYCTSGYFLPGWSVVLGQDPQVSKIFDGSSPPAACVVPSSRIHASQQEGSPHSGSSLTSLCPVKYVMSSAVGSYIQLFFFFLFSKDLFV